eukprot:jgi/Astpho2/2304/Aster-x0526
MDIDERQILIHKKQQRSPDYLAMNPLGKIPCLKEGDFVLPESAAILRYLCNSRHAADHWYPSDPKKRARVDAVLDWYHGNVRAGAAALLGNRVLWKTLGLLERNEGAIAQAERVLKAALKTMERVWLKGRPFVAGSEISIADLLYASELDMLRMLETVPEGPKWSDYVGPHPEVQAWMQRVAATVGPEWGKANKLLDLAVRRGKERLQQQQQPSKL